jgi:ATP-binding cassette subfamily B protein
MAIDGASTRITDSVNSTFNIVFGFVAASVAFYTIITIDVYAGLFLVFPLVGNFYFGKLVNSIYSGRYTDNIKNERKIQYINRVMYLSEYAKEIRYSNVHTLLMQKFNESVNDTVKVMDRYGNKGTRLMWFKNTLTFPIAFEGIMIYTAYRTIVSQSMSLADFAIIYGTMATTSWILIGLFNSITDSLKNGLFIGYVNSFLEYKEKIPEDQEGIMPEKLIQSIEFRAVTFYYQEEEPILHNISFKIENNACVALVGHNGTGKSTLIKLLLRLYDPISGEIYVNGINIKEYNLKAYREIFSVAFQDYKIMAMSIKDNVLMGKRVSNPDEIVNKSLERVGLQDKIKGFPQGNETHLTKEFNSEGEVMSGGEYQKVIVARAFAQDSAVKIFDEPSSALDPIAEYELYNSIMQDRGKGIMIFISHRLSSVKDADYVYMMEHGAILEMGSHEALMEKGGIYSDMYKKQAMNYLAVENF